MTFSNSIGKKSNGLAILPTGTSSGNTGQLQFRELATNGTNYVSIKAPDLLSSNLNYTLPDAYPVSNGQVLSSTTSGVMSWSTPSGGSSLGDNLIINPEMVIAQRGTSFASAASGIYTLDRFTYGKAGTFAHTLSQDNDVPSVSSANYLFTNSYLATVTTAQTSIGVNDLASILVYKVEGYDFKRIAQQSFTFSFWIKSSITGTFSIAFTNSGGDRSYVSTYTINSANTWEKKTITVSASPSAGTWNYTNGVGLRIDFNVAAGATIGTTTFNTWLTGGFYGASNGTNGVGTNGATFRITGLKLELGSVATDFKPRHIADEIELCQRYFEKSYLLTVNPGSTGVSGQRGSFYQSVTGNGSNVSAHTYAFSTVKRAIPTVTVYSNTSGAAGFVNDNNGSDLAVNLLVAGVKNYLLQIIQITARYGDIHHFAAVSEL